jgi:hypothetical protein
MGRAQRRQVTVHDAFTHRRQPPQLLADLDGFYNLEARTATSGEVPERPIGPVSKTGVAATSPRVRIPPSPLDYRNRPSTKAPQGLLRVKTKFYGSITEVLDTAIYYLDIQYKTMMVRKNSRGRPRKPLVSVKSASVLLRLEPSEEARVRPGS